MSKTILVVEDSLSIQHLVQRTFEPEGFRVVVANDAQEGLDTLRTTRPDIVLADAVMPGMDGMQLCQTLRGMSGYAQTPVLILTSSWSS